MTRVRTRERDKCHRMNFQRFTGRFKASLSGFSNHPSECSNLEAKQKICRTKNCSEEGVITILLESVISNSLVSGSHRPAEYLCGTESQDRTRVRTRERDKCHSNAFSALERPLQGLIVKVLQSPF